MTSELKQGDAGVVRKDANQWNSVTQVCKADDVLARQEWKRRPMRVIGPYVKNHKSLE
jgi:hypothetical protein